MRMVLEFSTNRMHLDANRRSKRIGENISRTRDPKLALPLITVTVNYSEEEEIRA